MSFWCFLLDVDFGTQDVGNNSMIFFWIWLHSGFFCKILSERDLDFVGTFIQIIVGTRFGV